MNAYMLEEGSNDTPIDQQIDEFIYCTRPSPEIIDIKFTSVVFDNAITHTALILFTVEDDAAEITFNTFASLERKNNEKPK